MGGIGKIWFHSLSAYARDHDFTGIEFTRFVAFVHGMDEEYIAFINSKQSETTDKDT